MHKRKYAAVVPQDSFRDRQPGSELKDADVVSGGVTRRRLQQQRQLLQPQLHLRAGTAAVASSSSGSARQPASAHVSSVVTAAAADATAGGHVHAAVVGTQPLLVWPAACATLSTLMGDTAVAVLSGLRDTPRKDLKLSLAAVVKRDGSRIILLRCFSIDSSSPLV
jgi:hypothetical protein